MKKKVMALLTTAIMLCALTTTALAAPSVSAETAPTVSTVTASDGTVIPSGDLTVTAVVNINTLPPERAQALQSAYQEVRQSASTRDFLERAGVSAAVERQISGTGVQLSQLTVHSIFDVSATGTAAEILAANGSVNITFSVPTLRAGQVAIILHMTAGGWETVPSVTGAGQVTGTFTSLSPVMILVEEAAMPESGAGTGATGGGAADTGAGAAGDVVTAPQTSDISFDGAFVCGALLCAAALAFCLKRVYAK